MIEAFLQSLLAAISASPIVSASSVALDKRTVRAGLIRGDLYFADGSCLHFRELVEQVQTIVVRHMYSYHYQDAEATLIFRYDDAPHHPALSGFPHHKHTGNEVSVIAATPPTLPAVLHEIESIHPLPGADRYAMV